MKYSLLLCLTWIFLAVPALVTDAAVEKPVVTIVNIASSCIDITVNPIEKFNKYELYRAEKNDVKYMEVAADTYAVNLVKVSKDSTNTEIVSEIKAITEKYYPSSKWKISVSKYSKSKATGELKDLKDIYEHYVTVVPTLTRLGKTTVTVKNMASSEDMKVTWTKVSGADKYEVWRKDGENGTYKKCNKKERIDFSILSLITLTEVSSK